MTDHAVLGPGGIGGLIGGALARAGANVTVIPRATQIAAYPDSLHIESVTLGDFEAHVSARAGLDSAVDVLWVTVKNQQLGDALEAVSPAAVRGSLIVPLMNGIDHVAVLRNRYPASVVIAGAIRTESTRVEPGHIVHKGWHAQQDTDAADPRFPRPVTPVQLAGPSQHRERVGRLARELEKAGVPCQVWDDENYLLWNKLAILCPYALATTAVAGPIGSVRANSEVFDLMLECAEEILDVAASVGVQLDRVGCMSMIDRFPDSMRVSMERDASAGLPIEIDAITTPVLRVGTAHGIPVKATERLRLLASESYTRLLTDRARI
jgi:2-dehydropantoate 2-reductase